MMSYKRYIVSVLSLVGAFVALQVGLNLYYDFYGVFRSATQERPAYNLNQRVAKMNYLDERVGEYNGWLLGSSRVGKINPQRLTDQFGERFYNLGVFSGTPKDYLLMLKHLKKQGHPLDRVVIGLDYFPFYIPPNLSLPDFMHRPDVASSDASWRQDVEFYLSYLVRPGFVFLATDPCYFFSSCSANYQHNIATGEHRMVKAAKEIARDGDAYWRNVKDKALASMSAMRNESPRIDPAQFDALRDLNDWLALNVKEYVFFQSPRHPVTDVFYTPEEEARFAKLLASILVEPVKIPIPDLMGDEHFMDIMHYGDSIADRIIDVLSASRTETLARNELQNPATR